MGNQDEQRNRQFPPRLGLPGSRQPRRALADASTHIAVPAAEGDQGSQFRRFPALGKRRNPAAPVQDAAAFWEHAKAQSSWDDRFAARHTPDRDDAPPRDRREERDAAWAARERDMRTGADAGWNDAGSARHDPWPRDWEQWTTTNLPVDDILNYQAEDRRHSRAAWGGEPDPATMVSVALVVDLPAPAAKGNTKPKAAFAQLAHWVNHRFAASARPTRRAMRVLLASTLLGIVLLTGLGSALAAYVDYTTIKGLATDAINSLGHLSDDLGLGKNTTLMTDEQRSTAANHDVAQAATDMQELHDRLAHPDLILGLAGRIGKVQTLLQSGLALSSIGLDATAMLETLVPTLVSLSKIISSSPIAASTTPQAQSGGLTSSAPGAIAVALTKIQPTLTHMIGLVQATPPSTLVAALSAKQQAELLPLLRDLPGLPTALKTLAAFMNLPSINKLLGIDTGIPNYNGPVGYLIMTLDNSEIRPVGGFQGQFAVVGVDHGRIGHITLQDVYNYLEPVTYSNEQGQGYAVYDQYRLSPLEGWFPAANAKGVGLGWVMRNSGLSPDFPQSARFALWYLHNENLCVATDPSQQSTGTCAPCALDNAIGQQPGFDCYSGGDRIPQVASNGAVTGFGDQVPMAGVIMIQSTIIQQLLEITGPVTIGCPYYRTVDAAHLKYFIHYYQETYAGRQTSMRSCPTQASDTTKRFTGLLTQALQAKLQNLPKDKLLDFLGIVLQDLETKNIQMFFTDPAQWQNGGNGPNAFANGYNPTTLYPQLKDVENFLRHYHDSGEMYQVATNPADSLSLNRADIVGWKLEPYMHLSYVDHIQLGQDGSATHTFQATYDLSSIPAIPGAVDANGNPTTATKNAVYAVVYNAGFYSLYSEVWRVYTNPNAIALSGGDNWGFYGPNDAREDVPNRALAIGSYKYSWSVNTNTGMVQWTADTQAPAVNWQVPSVVTSNGAYTIVVEPQSGVIATVEIDITLPNGTNCQVMKGPLAQTQTFTVNAARGVCHG